VLNQKLRFAFSFGVIVASSLGTRPFPCDAKPPAPRSRPVQTRATASDDGDECSGGVIEVSTFASVRTGPSIKNEEIARLTNGASLLYCDESAPGWVGVLLNPKGIGSCFPEPVPAGPYRGPCRSGWVSAKYAKVSAG
jgi:hypothetical protein